MCSHSLSNRIRLPACWTPGYAKLNFKPPPPTFLCPHPAAAKVPRQTKRNNNNKSPLQIVNHQRVEWRRRKKRNQLSKESLFQNCLSLERLIPFYNSFILLFFYSSSLSPLSSAALSSSKYSPTVRMQFNFITPNIYIQPCGFFPILFSLSFLRLLACLLHWMEDRT